MGQAQPNFIYCDRLDTESFRLAKIVTEDGNEDGSDMHWRLEKHNLSAAPPYVALSYAWNEPQSQHTASSSDIVINDQRVRLKPNLFLGFQQLTSSDNPLKSAYWWIDSVCINQSDIDEQSNQVSRMHDIFHNATEVIIWLGADSKNQAYELREFFRSLLCKYFDPEAPPTCFKYETGFLRINMNDKYGLPLIQTPIWQSALDFWRRKWFSRTWIMQEFAVNERTRIFCGDVEFTDTEIVEVSRFNVLSGLSELFMDLEEGMSGRSFHGRQIGGDGVRLMDLRSYASGIAHMERSDETTVIDRLTGPIDARSHPLLRVFAYHLWLSQVSDASDPRDKVFALVVLMKQIANIHGVSDTAIQVSYADPLEEVYQTATAWVILHSACLGFLCVLPPDRKLEDCIAGCSWIPDYRRDPQNPLLLFHSGDESQYPTTEEPAPGLTPYISDGYNLYIHAKRVGTVTAIGDTEDSILNQGCLELSARVLLNCPVTMPKHNNLSRVEVWRRTLLGVSAYKSEPDEAASNHKFHSFLACCGLRGLVFKHKDGLITRFSQILAAMPSFELLAETDTSEPRMLPDWGCWQDLIKNRDRAQEILRSGWTEFKTISIARRRLFSLKTESGVMLGYGPEVMDEGDEVWIAAGSPLPLLMRRRDATRNRDYVTFGEVYIIDFKRLFEEFKAVKWQRLKVT